MILYLDCDTGVDDALALAVLLATPHVEIAGIGTVSGNTSAGQAATNTLNLLALAGRGDVPVAVGEHHPLAGAFDGGAAEVHGDNGIGGVDLPAAAHGPIDARAADLLVELARARPGELHVLATGPLTNLARALITEPRLPDLVAGVTAMGGAVRVPGNITGHAEANIANDPEAAAAVLAAPWPVTLVPLDVTMRNTFDEADRAALRAAGTPLPVALADMLADYFDYYEPVLGVREVPLHDPLAAGVLTGELEPADAPLLGLRVDTGTGPERGRIIEDPGADHRVRVVFTLARPAGRIIRTRIVNGS
jgi:inosine-uridine nucleoside N-ribohydrolase